MEISRPIGNFMEEFRENFLRNSSMRSPESWLVNLGYFKLILSEFVELVRHHLFIVDFIGLGKLILDGLETSSINHAFFDKFLRVYFKDIRTILYLFIHDRLSEIRLILLVVTVSSISNDVNEDIFLEFLSILNCNFHALVQDIGLITIYVDYWSIDCLCYLRAVVRRSTAIGISRESDLIVQDDVNNTSRTVIDKILEAK